MLLEVLRRRRRRRGGKLRDEKEGMDEMGKVEGMRGGDERMGRGGVMVYIFG